MSYLDRIKASYQAGRADQIRARELARRRAAEQRVQATLAAKKAPPIRAVRAAGRIIESTRPAITGAQKIAGSLGNLSQPKQRAKNPTLKEPPVIKTRPKLKKSPKRQPITRPKKSMLW